MRSFKQIGNRSMPNQKVKGFQDNENRYCATYQNRSLDRWSVNYIRSQVRGTTLGTGGVQECQVSILWNCGLWAHHVVLFFNRSSDILHSHDSKACQGVPCQLCRQQCWYQGRGTKRTIFLLVERGGPIGKVPVHQWLPKCHQQQ